MKITTIAAFLLAGAATSAMATPTYYTDKALFLLAAEVTSFESFELAIDAGPSFGIYSSVSVASNVFLTRNTYFQRMALTR